MSVHVASAVAAQQEDAQDLLDALSSGILELFTWQLWWYGHLAPSGCPALRASPVVAGLAIF